jgi:hypothetical protein
LKHRKTHPKAPPIHYPTEQRATYSQPEKTTAAAAQTIAPTEAQRQFTPEATVACLNESCKEKFKSHSAMIGHLQQSCDPSINGSKIQMALEFYLGPRTWKSSRTAFWCSACDAHFFSPGSLAQHWENTDCAKKILMDAFMADLADATSMAKLHS